MINNTMENQWVQFAKDFEIRNNYVVGKTEIDRIKTRLTKLRGIGEVLELGCGNGTYTQSLVTNAESIVATDISKEMLRVCAARFKDTDNVTTQLADGFNLPFASNSFDTVFMANLLHIVPDQQKLLAECYRVLRPYGKVIVMSVTMYQMTLWNRIKLLYRYHKTYGKKPDNASVLTPESCQALFEKIGLTMDEHELLGSHTHALLCQGIKR